jgi:chromosome segregation ATPase
MTAATDTDIREIKAAIEVNTKSIESIARVTENIARATEANTKAIADLATSVTGLREEMRVGFARLDGKIDNIDGRLLAVENRIGGLDTRLWTFGGIILGAVLAALLTIFGRYIFTGNPIA